MRREKKSTDGLKRKIMQENKLKILRKNDWESDRKITHFTTENGRIQLKVQIFCPEGK